MSNQNDKTTHDNTKEHTPMKKQLCAIPKNCSGKRCNIRAWIALCILVVIGGFLRFYHADTKQLWGDEIHTYEASNMFSSFIEFYRFWRHNSRSIGVMDPPLFYMFNYWNCSSPTEMFSFLRLRVPCIILGILCIPLAYRVVLRFCCDSRIALLTAGMVAFSTYAIEYSHEYRPYSMLMLVSLLFIDALLIMWERFSWKRWSWFVFTAALLIYTHIFGLFFLAVAYLFWGGRLYGQVAKRHEKWVAFVAMPLVLIALYTPIFFWLLEFRALAKDGPVEGDKILYKNTGPAFPILVSNFSTWRYGTLCSYPIILWSVYALTALGVVSGLLISWKKHLVMILCVVTYFVMTVGIYHLCTFPFDARRSIGVLPAFLYIWCLGCLFPYVLARRFFIHWSARAISILLTVLLFGFYGYLNFNSWKEYDAAGWRDETGQADWDGMAKFVATHSTPATDALAFDTGLWTSLHYRFYKLRHPIHLPMLRLSSAAATDRERTRKNIWFVYLCNRTDGAVSQYIADANAKWIPFFGGALVYLPKLPDTLANQTFTINRYQAGTYILADANGAPYDGALRISYHGENIDVNSSKSQAPAMEIGEGIYSVSANENATTLALFRQINIGEWNSSLSFSNLHYSDKSLVGVNFPLVNGEAITSLLYNSTLVYNVALSKQGKFKLSMRAKNDKPGPVKVRVFVGGREFTSLVFDKMDNSFDVQSSELDIKGALVSLKFYCTSFSRDRQAVGPYNNQVTEFDMVEWKLDEVTE